MASMPADADGLPRRLARRRVRPTSMPADADWRRPARRRVRPTPSRRRSHQRRRWPATPTSAPTGAEPSLPSAYGVRRLSVALVASGGRHRCRPRQAVAEWRRARSSAPSGAPTLMACHADWRADASADAEPTAFAPDADADGLPRRLARRAAPRQADAEPTAFAPARRRRR